MTSGNRWRVERGWLSTCTASASTRRSIQAAFGRRAQAARARRWAFALAPDLLLLDRADEPLDIDGITLLEDLLLKGPALIVITHDRTFLDRVATRIVELDRPPAAPRIPATTAHGRSARDRTRRGRQREPPNLEQFWQRRSVIRKCIERGARLAYYVRPSLSSAFVSACRVRTRLRRR